jgi:serine/threonine protein kinase
LPTICIPQNVQFIGKAAFRFCTQLSGATFDPDSRIICIESSAFGKTALRSLALPLTVRSIRAEVIPESREVSCPGMDTASAFSERNAARRQNPSLVFELPSSPEHPALDIFLGRLSDYPTIKEIGIGGFGIVYLSEDPRTKQPVAVTVMKCAALNKDEKQLFVREVEIFASVDRPTLLVLSGFVSPNSDAGDPPAIVTDFMPRGSYDRLLTAERKGEPPSGWDSMSRFIVLSGSAVGMEVLHSKRIIHRDLKPENVLLNNAFEPRSAEFGLSKLVAQGQSLNQSMFGGTVRFMAPEIHEGERYDWSADASAYGILAYVATTGLDVFPEFQGFRLIKMIVEGRRPPFPHGFEGRCQNLIEACLQPDPKNRPTFQAIVARLSSAEFVNESIDINRFRTYQSCVQP